MFLIRLSLTVVVCVSLIIPGTLGQVSPSTVATTEGNVTGTVYPGGWREFRNIPYAEPPVGDLRWKATVFPPAKYANGNRNATVDNGYVCCSQIASPTVQGICTGGVKEDCLVLHVMTPVSATKPNAKLPVIVWIHGGGFLIGYGARNNASFMANTHDVVVVKLNYRVGAFGFLQSPDLLADANGKGLNFGLQDQIAALNWVQANIAAFGGDPSDVTVAGESAGAISIGWLTFIPQAAGLFNKVIMESGSPGADDAQAVDNLNSVAGQWQRALKYFNVTDPKLTAAQRVAALRNVSADDLVTWTFKGGAGLYPGIPTIDGVFIKKNSWKLLKEGKFNDNLRAVIIGDNQDEGTMFTATYGTNYSQMASFLNGSSAANALAPDVTINEELYPNTWVESMLALYFEGRKGDRLKEYDGAAELVGDFLFFSNGRRFAEVAAAAGLDVYKFRFDVNTTGVNLTDANGFYTGVAHQLELPFVWLDPTLAPADQRTSSVMGASWASLAKHGDPNVEIVNITGVDAWPKYNSRERMIMLFGPNGSATAVPEESLTSYSGYRKVGNELIQEYYLHALDVPRAPISPDGRCGASNGGFRCPSNGRCCSNYGWCGNGTEYCGKGCNKEGSFTSFSCSS